MGLRLADRWIWDFWLARDARVHHAFYLQAPRSLADPELRHWSATIGHAVSRDLVTWDPVVDALGPGPDGSWDSQATWTGSVVRFGGEWRMYYTGVSRDEAGLVQRIGLATSPDLFTWTKHPANPIIETDARWYETLESGTWKDQAWRDPWVSVAPGEGLLAYITARARHGVPEERGVVALASSPDGIAWKVHPPVAEPGEFGSLEVPQVVRLGDRWYLIVSVAASEASPARLLRKGRTTGVHYLEADDRRGPFRWAEEPFLAGDEAGTRYAGKLVEHHGGLYLLTTRSHSADGFYLGELGDLEPVTVGCDGRLTIGA